MYKRQVKKYLTTLIPVYPYEEIIQLETAYARYLALEHPEDSKSYRMVSALPISSDAMLEHVKANNDAYLAVRSIENSVFRPLEDDYLAWVCEVVADTVNRELTEQDFGDRLTSVDWNLKNLKILTGRTVANASYLSGSLMQVRPSGTDAMVTITGDEMAAHKTITHEVEPVSYTHLSHAIPAAVRSTARL